MVKESKLEVVSGWITFIILVIAFASLPIILICKLSEQNKDYNELQDRYTNALIDLKEYETAYELVEDMYGEQDTIISRLQNQINELEEANNYTPEYIEQIFEDFEDCNEIIIDYYENGFHENNPSVSLENYIKMRDLELYLRVTNY